MEVISTVVLEREKMLEEVTGAIALCIKRENMYALEPEVN